MAIINTIKRNSFIFLGLAMFFGLIVAVFLYGIYIVKQEKIQLKPGMPKFISDQLDTEVQYVNIKKLLPAFGQYHFSPGPVVGEVGVNSEINPTENGGGRNSNGNGYSNGNNGNGNGNGCNFEGEKDCGKAVSLLAKRVVKWLNPDNGILDSSVFKNPTVKKWHQEYEYRLNNNFEGAIARCANKEHHFKRISTWGSIPLWMFYTPHVESWCSNNSTITSLRDAKGPWQITQDTARLHACALYADFNSGMDCAVKIWKEAYAVFHRWDCAVVAYGAGTYGTLRELYELHEWQRARGETPVGSCFDMISHSAFDADRDLKERSVYDKRIGKWVSYNPGDEIRNYLPKIIAFFLKAMEGKSDIERRIFFGVAEQS